MAFLAPIAMAAGGALASGLVNKIGKSIGIFKAGGKVPKTGNYKLHKGEVVIPVKQVKKLPKSMKALKKRKPGRPKK